MNRAPEPAEHWDAVYAAKPDTALSWHERDAAGAAARIAALLPDRGAGIVDIGSGRTRLLAALIGLGYRDLTALDPSSEALEQARAALGPAAAHVSWIVADVARWAPPRVWDLWHDRAVLHFLTGEEARAGYRAALLAALRPGGLALISTFALDGPERCSGLSVRRYGRDEMAAFLGPEFETLEASASEHVTPAGAVQRFHSQIARRR